MVEKKIKYVKQKDTYTCGPVALINVLRWAGQLKVNPKYLKAIKAICFTDKNQGTYSKEFDRAIKYFRPIIKIKTKKKPDLKDIDNCVDKGGIVVIGYVYKFHEIEQAHFALIIGRTKTRYILVNDSRRFIFSTSRPSALEKKLKYVGTAEEWKSVDRDERCCKAWFVEKRKRINV